MEGIAKPNVVIYLKPAEGTDSSKRTNFGAERYETPELQAQVIENYDNLFENEKKSLKILQVNASQAIESVSEAIWTGIVDSI